MFLTILIVIIAFLHFYFFLLEAIFWQKPLGLKVFHLEPAFAKQSAALAANQGVYNLFLSAGLIWSIISSNPLFGWQLKIFFLGCVAIAGVVGALTVSRRIFYIQAMPAIAGICLLLFF